MFQSSKSTILLFSLFVLLNCYLAFGNPASSTSSKKDPKDICKNPPPISTTKTNNESDWDHQDLITRRHIHFGSKSARLHMASYFHGKTVENEVGEDFSDLCATVDIKYSAEHVDGDILGFGDEVGEFRCTVSLETLGNLNCILKSRKNPEYVGKTTVHPHYIDRILVSTWCFDDGEVGWMVWSTHDYLTSKEEKTVYDYLETLGFDPEDSVPFSTFTCGAGLLKKEN